MCGQPIDLVCGCDGNTYDNVCNAHAAGVNVGSVGECSSSSTGSPSGGPTTVELTLEPTRVVSVDFGLCFWMALDSIGGSCVLWNHTLTRSYVEII